MNNIEAKSLFENQKDKVKFKKTNYQKLMVSNLAYDNYQRILRPHWVRNTAKVFEPGLLGVIIVSFREGKYYIIDGQHRVEMLKLLGIKAVVCQVFYGLDRDKEAEMYEKYNLERNKMLPADIFRSMLVREEPDAIKIQEIVENNGFKLKLSGATMDNQIAAIKTILNIYNSTGAAGFDRMLYLLRRTWMGQKDSLESNLLKGMAIFIKLYEDDFKDDIFIKRLSTVAPAMVIQEAKRNSILSCSSRFINPYAATIQIIYNKGTKKNKLPNKLTVGA